jgi:4-hydroxy-4-methyl-2-oxoglutarate aldolase
MTTVGEVASGIQAGTPAALIRHQIRERFLAVDTSNVADVLDQIGCSEQGLSAEFQPFPASTGKLAGWAYTIRGQMVPYEGTGDATKMEACQGVGPDVISVWSGDGEGICYFGELIALGMQERGCVGALVDGGIRDVRWIGEHKFPVYARYRTPVQSIGRWRVTGCQEPVYLRGATSARVMIRPDDFVLCDEDGGIVIPATHVLTVLEESEKLTHKEVLIREELTHGLSLQQALDKYGHV